MSVRKLQRLRSKKKKKPETVYVTSETKQKLKELADREDTTVIELVRFLTDLAYAGEIDFGEGE